MIDETILKILRTRREGYVSGEEICKLADVSRAAIWKHIEKLREEGYEIEASPHLGYRLVHAPDRLIPSEIQWNMKTRTLGRDIISYKKLDSTNDAAYEMAENNCRDGLVVIAEEQMKGKGRHGRHWTSPPKGGIYLSCVLRPDMPPEGIPRITLLAAVSLATSIRKVSGLEASIKWPNDILIHNKKVCGILTEMKAEQDNISFVVVGIGVNVNTAAKALPRGASSIREEMRAAGRDVAVSRVELTRNMLETLDSHYYLLRTKGFGPIIEEWKALSSMLGSRIRVVLHNRTFDGTAHDLDSDGSLVVRLDSGILEKVSSGDVEMVR
ncbi:MAG: biotin--[acetyl-CoA-carboxylase] ligase [Candidatus Omnitrophota bacterium]